MEPRNWQLKNRIKWNEVLRSGKYTVEHGMWFNGSGGCVLGIYVLNESDLNKLGEPKEYLCRPSEGYLEMAEDLGLNYLELRDIANVYEGGAFPDYNSDKYLTHAQIADYIEKKHITPYMYMLGKYPKKRELMKV